MERQRIEADRGRAGHRRGQPLDGGVPIGAFHQPQRPHGPLGVLRGRRRMPERSSLSHVCEELARGLQPSGRRGDGDARGKLAGQRLHRVQLMHGQVTLQLGRATPDLRPRGR